MSRPQVIVTVGAAVPRRGADSVTGTTFYLYAAASGGVAMTPTVCKSAADATAFGAPTQVAQWVGDALAHGAPRVVLVRATAVDPAAVTQTEWANAMALLTDEYGTGQVIIPGVTTTGAYNALLAHASAANRCALLDCAATPTVSTLVTTAAGLASAAGAERSTIVTQAVVSGDAGTTRNVPGSVIAAGLAARGDAYNGHANNAPIFDQGHGAGYVVNGFDIPKAFTTAELDSMADAGISVIGKYQGVVQLGGWFSLSTNDSFRQLNWGRMDMQLQVGAAGLLHQFLGRQIDGRGALFAEVKGAITGYLAPLWSAGALFGDTAADAFEVVVDDTINTPLTIAAGEVHSSVGVSLSPFTEKVYSDITTNIAQGVAA